jgi:hypothetical protein
MKLFHTYGNVSYLGILFFILKSFLFQFLDAFPLFNVYRSTQELSTPFLNIRWMLLDANLKNTKVFNYNLGLFLVTFTFCRLVFIVPFWMKFYSCVCSDAWNAMSLFTHCMLIVSNVPLDALNMYWYTLIVKAAYKIFKNQKKMI